MGHTPTKEQQPVIDASLEMVSGTHDFKGAIKTLAAAGAGKTSTLLNVGVTVKSHYAKAKILYLAYNREIKLEAERKFAGMADTFTTHSLALSELNLRATGRNLGNIHSGHVRQILGSHCSDADIDLVMIGLRNFCQGHGSWPSEENFPSRHRGGNVSQERKIKNAAMLEELWFELIPENKKSSLPVPHDVYLKYWQTIGAPGLDKYDLIMLDEAQDANPVILSALEGQGNSIYVGDSHQSIYQWRNAVDALQQVYGKSFPMTQSFRFGPVIAEAANTILNYKHFKPTHPLIGFERLNSYIGEVNRKQQHARIYRTNKALIQEALMLYDRNIRFAISGNNDEIKKVIESVWALKNGDTYNIKHPHVRYLKTWDRAVQEAENGSDAKDINQAIKIVQQYEERVVHIIDIFENFKDEANAQVIMTTAHRSKGREWDNVIIAKDFDPILEKAKNNKTLWDPEMNLLYVAVTRAMRCLEINCEWLKSALKAY